MTPLVSVLLPSRGRPESLHDSVLSLAHNAAQPQRTEYLVAADPDDPETTGVAARLGLKCWVAPERYGYHQLNRYFNELAARSTGRWLLLWNDDARMLTYGWDSVIATTGTAFNETVLVCDLWVDRHSPDLCTFPAVHRTLYEAAGGFSPYTPHCDTWWQDIGRALGVIRPVEVWVDHQRADLTGLHNDQTRADALAGYRSGEFYGEHVQTKMRETIAQIRAELTL